MAQSLIIAATYEALSQLKPFVELSAASADPGVKTQLVLAVHELCANIIRHAYDGIEGLIYLEAEGTPVRVQYQIRDDAPRGYAPPGQVLMPDPLSLPEGGWGIFILHEVMTKVEYRRLPDGNEWLLVKELPA